MYHRLGPARLAKLYDESKEKMTSGERQHWLDHRLRLQVGYAYNHAPAVKKKFDGAGVSPREIRDLKALENLPVTNKDELVKLQQKHPPFGGFLAVPLNSLPRIYVSPGPIYDACGLERVRSVVRSFLRAGWPRPGDTVIVSTAYHMVPAGLLATDALDILGCTVVPAGTGQSELQVKLLHDLQATVILSFPSFVMTVLQKAEEMGYDVRRDLNLKYIAGGGERHIQVLRQTFEEKYGLIVGDSYGTSDLGVVAYDCGLGQGYHYEDQDCLVEIVDPNTGRHVQPLEVGEVVVTLFSRIYPLVRFGTGDLASFSDEVCQCGRTVPRITRILGMIGDHVRVKGMFVHLRELEEAMKQFQQVSNYQMILSLEGHRDRMTLKIEAETDRDRQLLSEDIIRRCQEVFKLRVDALEFLPKGALPKDQKRFIDTRWQ